MDINISGMSCASCSASVEREVLKISGVKSCDVNLLKASAKINFDNTEQTREKIIKNIQKLGFKVSFTQKFDNKEEIYKSYKNKFWLSLIFTGLVLYISMGQMFRIKLPVPNILNMATNPSIFALSQLILTTIVLIIGKNFFISGIKKIKNPNMDTLVTIGVISAYIYSIYSYILILSGNMHAVHSLYFESSATIITLVLLGKTMETKALAKTTNAISKLLDLTPNTAILVLKDGTQKEIKFEDINVDDILLVKAGSKIPTDGEIIKGNTYIDESMLTGESIPPEKTVGDKVFTGTINKNGVIYVKALNVGRDTLLSKIIKYVDEASATKAPIAKLADVISGKFVPIVIIIATISALLWSFKGIEFALTIFVSVLVIACPCALGLATPTAIMVGTGRSALLGILFKNSQTLEITHKADAIVFDKTGTITQGKPKVTNVFANNIDQNELIKIVSSAESLSEHPLAKAIIDYYNSNDMYSVSDFTVTVGEGISCIINEKSVKIGKNVKGYDEKLLNKISAEGKTPILVEIDDKFAGIIAVADVIKDDAKAVIEKIKNLGIEVYMLTGDNEITAKAISQKVDITNVCANVYPADKMKYIESLQDMGKKVIMVGDGINDAPALIKADVGIAVGSGTDIAMESSDIVILNDELESIVNAIKLSKKTLKNIKTNLFLAFIYNIAFIPVAAGVLYIFGGPTLNPMFAALAMSFSSVSVLLNALRLYKTKI